MLLSLYRPQESDVSIEIGTLLTITFSTGLPSLKRGAIKMIFVAAGTPLTSVISLKALVKGVSLIGPPRRLRGLID